MRAHRARLPRSPASAATEHAAAVGRGALIASDERTCVELLFERTQGELACREFSLRVP
jgi:hypothetical protein